VEASVAKIPSRCSIMF